MKNHTARPPAPPISGSVRLLSATEAARQLGVTKATLYAYASRGLLQAVADIANPRASRYSSFEVEQLALRRRHGRRREEHSRAALVQGWPVLDTRLSGIVDGQLVYRGRNAVDMSRECSLEDVARWLWQFDPHDPFDAEVPVLSSEWLSAAARGASQPLAERTMARFATALAECELPSWLPEGPALAHACGQHLRLVVASFLGRLPSAEPVSEQFARAWGLPPAAAELLRRGMVLAAEHEMNLIGFTARQLSSVGASLGASLLGALCYLSASFNGGDTVRVEALWDEVLPQPDLRAALAARLSHADSIPGFNHHYYPAGDPRGAALLQACAEWGAPAPPIAEEVERLTGWKPSLDFGLVALRRAVGAPRDAAMTLLMAARTVGILAHILEQRRHGSRMVVRARYTPP
ncbi:citrate synthase family protein [Ideonella sp. YS5]|uniref:citrate synthase family protein n=1 Tax=Ideonella sp. YS5 TaxID=3453714 RepID=UPI003EEF322C